MSAAERCSASPASAEPGAAEPPARSRSPCASPGWCRTGPARGAERSRGQSGDTEPGHASVGLRSRARVCVCAQLDMCVRVCTPGHVCAHPYMSVHSCTCVCAGLRDGKRSARWHGGASTEDRRTAARTDRGHGAEPDASTGRCCERSNFPAPKCDGSRLEPPASRGVIRVTQGLHIWKPLGPCAFPRDEPGRAGAAQAPVPAGARTAAGLIDALLTTESTQMTNDGCRRGRRRLCHPPQGLSESMEFITLTLFPLSEGQLLAVLLCR